MAVPYAMKLSIGSVADRCTLISPLKRAVVCASCQQVLRNEASTRRHQQQQRLLHSSRGMQPSRSSDARPANHGLTSLVVANGEAARSGHGDWLYARHLSTSETDADAKAKASLAQPETRSAKEARRARIRANRLQARLKRVMDKEAAKFKKSEAKAARKEAQMEPNAEETPAFLPSTSATVEKEAEPRSVQSGLSKFPSAGLLSRIFYGTQYTPPSDGQSARQYAGEDDQRLRAASGSSKSAFLKDTRSRELKAHTNAQAVEEARQRRRDAPNSDVAGPAPKHVNFPGTGTGIQPTFLNFEATEIRYPPPDVYPPQLPQLSETDLLLAARVFGLHRSCELEWLPNKDSASDEPGRWKRVTRPLPFFEARAMYDYLDGEQSLEYIGDSVLHLVTRSILMTRFPRRASHAYNIAANFLVSNDAFGHVFDDAGLGIERQRIGQLLLEHHRERELTEAEEAQGLSGEEIARRRAAPLPECDLPAVTHQRKADLFEAFTGAVYLTHGFNKVSRWATLLFEPWVDRVARTPGFQSSHSLTPAGLAERRARKLAEAEGRAAILERDFSRMGTMQRFVRGVLTSVLPQRLFPELRRGGASEAEREFGRERSRGIAGGGAAAAASSRQQDGSPQSSRGV